MYGRRLYLGFGIIGLGAAVALTLSHLGHDALVPVAILVAAFGVTPLFPREIFRLVAERLPAHLDAVAIYGTLARHLADQAGIVLHIISASISAAGVGILAMLPIGARLDARTCCIGMARV